MTRIALDTIAFDAGTQVRASLDQAVVDGYADRMTEGDAFPPIVVFTDGTCSADGTPLYFLGDGFHRTMAARKNAFIDIDADVRHGDKRDALWFALGANKTNGHQMTMSDRRHAIRLAIRTWGDSKSSTQIAEQMGVAQQRVSEIRGQIRQEGQVTGSGNLTDRVTGKDGKSYPAARRKQPAPPPIQELPRSIDRTSGAAQQRRDQIRVMAAEGHSVPQIASAVGLAEATLRNIVSDEKIDVPAGRVLKNTHRHDPNRILENIVMDAENLTAGAGLIDFGALDRERLGEWIDSLNASHKAFASFIKRLIKEKDKHVEAA